MFVYQRVSWFLTPMSSLPYPIYSLEFTAFFKRQLSDCARGLTLQFMTFPHSCSIWFTGLVKKGKLTGNTSDFVRKIHGKSMENPEDFPE
jgi:hypothetical protein